MGWELPMLPTGMEINGTQGAGTQGAGMSSTWGRGDKRYPRAWGRAVPEP